MTGQYTHEEFLVMYGKNGVWFNILNNTACIKYGQETYNYYKQHPDGSWTNYDCRTKKYFVQT